MNNTIVERIDKLRSLMREKAIDFYIIPTSDFHQTEAVGSYFKAREYMSGFTGTEGTLIVGQDEAKLWVDGRYFLQGEKELCGTGIDKMEIGEKGVPDIAEYLAKRLGEKGTIGFDGRVVNTKMFFEMEAIVKKVSGKLIVTEDLVNEIWTNRPNLPKDKGWMLSSKITGESVKSKLQRLRDDMYNRDIDGYIFSGLDDIAWLLNMRGKDVEFFPVVLAYFLVMRNKAILFVDQQKLNDELRREFYENKITIRGYDEVYEYAKDILNSFENRDNVKISINTDILNSAIYQALPQDIKIIDEVSPVVLWKACKNPTEISNNKNAHIKDGVAVTKFIKWLKEAVLNKEKYHDIDEYKAGVKLGEFRRKQEGFIFESFETISAYKENGAIVHYHPPKKGSKKLENKGMLLLDSGGHYEDGTTDVTRTIPLGNLTEEEKKCYTAVLRGMIRLSKVKFLYGCNGKNLDILARGVLWDIGLDYKHGTGHGVGYILNVHEDPIGIRWREVQGINDMAVFEEGMITSNEPGIYFEDKFGIRIENEMVVQTYLENQFGKFMKFEPLTWIPIDTENLILEDMNGDEIAWLNWYHGEVLEKISPYLEEEERKWLENYIKPI